MSEDERQANLPDGTEPEIPHRTEPSLADEAQAEQRRIREDNEARQRAHSRTEVELEVPAVGTTGNEDVKNISVKTADGKLYINTFGEKVLDHDGVAHLQKVIAHAFQAVS